MARTQTFSTPDVVRAARDVFWDTGYDGTSIGALEAATGLNRSSLYNTFGSKRGLFDAAVQDYLDTVIRPRLVPLDAAGTAPGSGTQALLDYFGSLRRAVLALPGDGPRRGCLLVDSAAGLAAQDPVAAAVVDGYRAELTAALRTAVVSARGATAAGTPGSAGRPGDASAGGTAAGTDADATARVLASLSIGAMVVARVNPREAAGLLSTACDVVTGAVAV